MIEKLTNAVAPFTTCTRSKSRSWRAGVGTPPPRCGGTMYLHHIGACQYVRTTVRTSCLDSNCSQPSFGAGDRECGETYACSTSSLSIRPTFSSFRSTVNGFTLIALLSAAESTTGAG